MTREEANKVAEADQKRLDEQNTFVELENEIGNDLQVFLETATRSGKEHYRTYTGHKEIDLFLDECLETMRVKGHDYRQGNDSDLLHNFRTVAESVGTDMEKVWFTYFYKHYSAMVTFIKEGGQSESEPIEGRIKDQIVYLLLFYQMVQERKRANVKRLGEIAAQAEASERNFKRLNDLKEQAKKQAELEMSKLNLELSKKDENARKMSDEEIRNLYKWESK